MNKNQFLVFSNRLLAMFLAAAIVYGPVAGANRTRSLKAPILQVGREGGREGGRE